jgi:hypothetical protein
METSAYSDSITIYTVSQVAKRLKLSRARFYQLLDQGVFPPPVYCCRSRKPLYTTGLLTQCRIVRKTGVGINGQLVRFNAMRKRRPNTVPKKLTTALRGLGLSVTPGQVSKGIHQLGLKIRDEKAIDGDAIRKLFNHLNQECQIGV